MSYITYGNVNICHLESSMEIAIKIKATYTASLPDLYTMGLKALVCKDIFKVIAVFCVMTA